MTQPLSPSAHLLLSPPAPLTGKMSEGPQTVLRFKIKGEGLVSKDYMSASDPMVIVSLKESEDAPFVEIGRTEWLKNEKNPDFTTKIDCDYFFEKKQFLEFMVVDVDDPKKIDNKTTDFIGKVHCKVAEILGSKKQTMTRKLEGTKEGKNVGSISVFAEELKGRKTDVLKIQMKGNKLANKDGMFGKSDPYLIFRRKQENGEMIQVLRSKTIDNNLDPDWEELLLNLTQFCLGNLDAPIVIECWDEDSMSKDDMIGTVETTTRALLNKEKLQLKDYKEGRNLDPGYLTVTASAIVRIPTFLDYVCGGCEMSLSVAVDFTASNKDPSDPTSLHHVDPNGNWNEYQKAIIAVGEILLDYDHDKKCAALGYGAILPNKEEASHCFALNGNAQNPEVEGVQGLLDAYASSLKNVKLYGPTNFKDIIERNEMLAREQSKEHYHVMLIITDGAITDLRQTIGAIVSASTLPMSIVIVGVGEDDFSEMKQLDGDDGVLEDDNGKKIARDTVQFVKFREFQGNPAALARAVLHELPPQLLQYMCVNQRPPKNWKPEEHLELPSGNWAVHRSG
mmetsp:Transcript_25825/g.40429  ORF Transcript_25825/g.40429 Transcript_25825/m.40429 type:complete len:564 (-) Transcript_25825:61-1752(-)